jgi:ribosome maturation protein Sdo1
LGWGQKIAAKNKRKKTHIKIGFDYVDRKDVQHAQSLRLMREKCQESSTWVCRFTAMA